MPYFTSEQHAIISAVGDLKINAVAGSGKTTTLLEYAKAQPARTRILYLAFNKTVKDEAKRKFAAAGLRNVRAETAHSLAIREVMRQHPYKLHPKGGYRAHELVELLKLPRGFGEERHLEHMVANHALKFAAYFCNKPEEKVQHLDYRTTVVDVKAREFVEHHYWSIEKNCRDFLARMDSGQIPITHDFYLKKYQLSRPVLAYDIILFDEGQDASEVMLEVFARQAATKVIVGDTHQQIYRWRHAVNSLEKTSYQSLPLSTSFRFGEPIAQLATRVLGWKSQLGEPIAPAIEGQGMDTDGVKTRAVIARTNLALLLKAIEYLQDHDEQLQRVYFEGNIKSYTYAGESASLYDVLALSKGRRGAIKDPLIRAMENLDDLRDYAEKTEDKPLELLITLVEEQGDEVAGMIEELKRRHVSDAERDQAQVYFSTVHRCKGMEYDEVQLVADFPTQAVIDKLEQQVKTKPLEPGERAKVMEEINLLYVAITRSRQRLHLPADCWPTGLLHHADIQLGQGTGGTVLLGLPRTLAVVTQPEVIQPAVPAGLVEQDAALATLQQRLNQAGH
ncbi:UvrD-helicase domain-containing protein [Hymenobacter terricola]|uniref:UvrD-helicase domain-containing protein n=1 Tax=Hymenobacter terricola TaxID=2819236 RepID=UPI001B308E6D|nr:UvrD-helicase domain-containing protein [Hymenobacter terricola]